MKFMKELPKAYEPQKYEDNIYKRWEDSGFFNPDVCIEKKITNKKADTFSIVLPPPNVTGTLHIGHAVMLAVEDVMVRYHRMKGDRTLWLPGTDHAAIATQSKVEKILHDEEGKTRHDLGREKFLKRVDEYAQKSHDTIVNQSKKMGASLDWSREAFTLDEERGIAVRTAFKKMYDDGLIYRGERIVNWDPKMQSNVSDDEIERKEEKAPFYYFKYGPFEIGTARPETKFGDKYVVMHPDDKRYKKYKHGDTFECEWINGKITATIIKDKAADPEFGTGVMTITPWHDTTDFYIAERHDLDAEPIIDLDGKLLPIAKEFAGMEISEARSKIVEKLKEKGLLTRVDEDYVHSVATNYRGGGVIEPQVRLQWFISVSNTFTNNSKELKNIKEGQDVSLKQLMQNAVRSKQIEILPERFDKIYFNWVDNLKDWCISRQIWYGHRIPVWYCKEKNCNAVIVSIEDTEKCTTCGSKKLEQDPDTLDTWFSSGLWTFSTLGWPEKTEDLKNFHPTTVMETGYDIIFFWVARMILMSTYLLGQTPFETVYLHGLVKDAKGKKMSKSLGNVIDPLDVCTKYGTDAVRLSLLIGMTPGNDTNLSIQKIENYRNFANKLWNISRFILLQVKEPKVDVKEPKAETLADQWLLSRLHDLIDQTTDDIENYRFSIAGEKLRDFTWNELADWYLEIAKIEGDKSDILNYTLNTVLKLWHPFMPFVTETLWQEMYDKDNLLMVEKWPAKAMVYPAHGFDIIKNTITEIRSLRNEYKIPQSTLFSIVVVGDKEGIFKNNENWFTKLGRIKEVKYEKSFKPKKGYVGIVGGKIEVFVDLSDAVDFNKESKRLEKEISEVAPYVKSLETKLSNKEFTANAPEKVIEAEKRKLADAKIKLEKLEIQKKTLKK